MKYIGRVRTWETITRREIATIYANLRQWEYYNLTQTFDELYRQSKENQPFNNLYDLIVSEQNILLAYRSIKGNKGSKTAGTDKIIIEQYKTMEKTEFIDLIQKKLLNYKPKKVRRVYIPKPNGDLRPLGIPSMIDRIIQQMFKQVLEPICEAKFYKHSYGFRPFRSAIHAKARCDHLINIAQHHYVVDIDIKGFFDNVNHTLLLKQLWNIGIQDRKVLAIISKMLKAPIDKEGIPTKGTPQGGILSPLLSNVVLNDIDQWVSGQWEAFETKTAYKHEVASKYRAMRTTKLKQGFIVRYADDFKIFAKDHETAVKWFHAAKLYLKDRLKLDISPEKSKVINLKKKHSEFLGFELKAVRKYKKYVCHSHVRGKKIQQIKEKARSIIKEIQKSTTVANVTKWNRFVLGLHQYFKNATHVSVDFDRIYLDLSKAMYNRFKDIGKHVRPHAPPYCYKKYYGKNKYKTWQICGIYLYPIQDIRTDKSLGFKQTITPYSVEGRALIHKQIFQRVSNEIQKLMQSNIPNRTVEYMDNRLSRYSMVMGTCEISGKVLSADSLHCHHYIPINLGGNDKYDNLRIIHKDIHKLVHATNKETVERYICLINPNANELAKINQYRKSCNLEPIEQTT